MRAPHGRHETRHAHGSCNEGITRMMVVSVGSTGIATWFQPYPTSDRNQTKDALEIETVTAEAAAAGGK